MSRMREIRQSGSEGGGELWLSPYPYRHDNCDNASFTEPLHLPDKPAGVESSAIVTNLLIRAHCIPHWRVGLTGTLD